MKIQTWVVVEKEIDVNVEIDDILRAFADELGKHDADTMPRRLTATLDYYTRVLTIVSDESIAQMKPAHRETIAMRLRAQADRYRVQENEPCDTP